MYDMYPDWGPARNNPDSAYSHEAQARALQQSLDLRDGWRDSGGERPDDN